MCDVNKKRTELLSLLNKNPHQPFPVLSKLWQSYFLTSRFYETYGLSIVYLSCGCCDWIPSGPFDFFAFVFIGVPSLFIGFMFSFLIAFVDLPHCCCNHHVSEAEIDWLTSSLGSANPELCAKNIDKYILRDMEKIAEELTSRYPSTPFLACKKSISLKDGDGGGTQLRDAYFICQGTLSSPSVELTV